MIHRPGDPERAQTVLAAGDADLLPVAEPEPLGELCREHPDAQRRRDRKHRGRRYPPLAERAEGYGE